MKVVEGAPPPTQRHTEDVPSVPYLSTRVCVAVPVMLSLLRAVTLLAGDMGGCLCVIRLCSVCNDLAWSRSLYQALQTATVGVRRWGKREEGARPSPRASL